MHLKNLQYVLQLRLRILVPRFHKSLGVPHVHQLQRRVHIDMELERGYCVRFWLAVLSLFSCVWLKKEFGKVLSVGKLEYKTQYAQVG